MKVFITGFHIDFNRDFNILDISSEFDSFKNTENILKYIMNQSN